MIEAFALLFFFILIQWVGSLCREPMQRQLDKRSADLDRRHDESMARLERDQ